MDPSTNFSLIQSIIVWTLLGLLLTWMIVFAVLALRRHSHQRLTEEDLAVPSHPLPGISSLVPKLNMITSTPRQSAETINAEAMISNEVVVRS